jgi:phosphotransferase system  glucose/maltose/N-acetylglucosamine-specific IIC component
MNIKIGNKNKIKNSSIGHHSNNSNNKPEKKKSFAEKHTVLISFFISLITGFILLFSFWGNVVDWVESFINKA